MPMQFKTLVIDDDSRQMIQMEDLLASTEVSRNMFKIVGRAYSYTQGLEALKTNRYDLTILDVFLDGQKDCYHLFEKVSNITNLGMIAITTSKDGEEGYKDVFKIKSFSHKLPVAPLWLPNPFSPDGLKLFLDQIQNRIAPKVYAGTKENPLTIPMHNIMIVSKAGNYAQYYHRENPNEKVHCDISMSQTTLIERNFNVDLFVKCHRSFLINKNCILGFDMDRKHARHGYFITNVVYKDKLVLVPYSKNFYEKLHLSELLKKRIRQREIPILYGRDCEVLYD